MVFECSTPCSQQPYSDSVHIQMVRAFWHSVVTRPSFIIGRQYATLGLEVQKSHRKIVCLNNAQLAALYEEPSQQLSYCSHH